jgi:hypothetical protein
MVFVPKRSFADASYIVIVSYQWVGCAQGVNRHYAAMVASNSGPLFRGEPTRRSTGHTCINPFGAGRNSAAQSPSACRVRLARLCGRAAGRQPSYYVTPRDVCDQCSLIFPKVARTNPDGPHWREISFGTALRVMAPFLGNAGPLAQLRHQAAALGRGARLLI